MEFLPKDVFTLIYDELSLEARTALFAAFPHLAAKVDWNALYLRYYSSAAKENNDRRLKEVQARISASFDSMLSRMGVNRRGMASQTDV